MSKASEKQGMSPGTSPGEVESVEALLRMIPEKDQAEAWRILYGEMPETLPVPAVTIYPGDIIAHAGAHQMQMALKNKAGGGVDPHAGHHH